HFPAPAITPAPFKSIDGCMRVLHTLTGLVLEEPFELRKKNGDMKQCSTEFAQYQQTLPDALQERCKAVFADFTRDDLEQQRARRLAEIAHLSLDIHRHHGA